MKELSIKGIYFESTKTPFCECDRCGQAIKNVWTVRFSDNSKMNLGIDCFEKIYKFHGTRKLTKMQESKFNKLLKKIKQTTEDYNFLLHATEEEVREKIKPHSLSIDTDDRDSCWFGETFENYKKWLIEESYPYKLERLEKEIAEFKKFKFNID